MPKNVFEQISEVNNDIQRNAFDWSHINNFTAKIGYIYPIFTELVPASSKFECNANLGLQFMPMKFPVQTQLKTRVSFFKVPLRTLWKDYKDWVGGFRNDIEPPYIDSDTTEKFDSMFSVGSLGDFLDITNVKYIGSDNEYNPIFSRSSDLFYPRFFYKQGKVSFPEVGTFISSDPNVLDIDCYSGVDIFTNFFTLPFVLNTDSGRFIEGNYYTFDLGNILPNKPEVFQATTPNIYTNSLGLKPYFFLVCVGDDQEVLHTQSLGLDLTSSLSGFTDDSIFITSTKDTLNFTSFRFDTTNVPQATLDRIKIISFCIGYSLPISNLESTPNRDTVINLMSGNRVVTPTSGFPTLIPFVNENVVSGSYEIINTDNTPYYSSNFNPDGMKLRAYRARAYEAIYNGYIRYSRNNPFYINGKVSYNEWIPNNDGGADNYHYQLHRANWELDMLTSAVSSPQQGKSPLVGLTQYVTTEPDSSGQMLQSYQMALVDEDGKKYRVKFSTDADGYVQAAVGREDEFEGYVEPLSYNKLVSANTDYGISIPDLRVVNAYQKYLELNQRKGYSYKDIIEGRFDVKVKYDDLLLPEFIGGYTRNVQMNRVIQSVDLNRGSDNPNYAGALGSLAGDAFLSTDDTPRISTFCDEECIIMGIMSVVPVPTYSQILPKDYLYNDILDHFQPEFNNLGFQPIRYAEVCPLQLKDFGLSPDDVFGYQRPWYEYVQKLDRVHGQMRTNMRDFLFNRVFVNVPKLTESFLLVDPKHLNDVFQYTDDDDKIVGQIYFDCKADLPIHRVAIGRLE